MVILIVVIVANIVIKLGHNVVQLIAQLTTDGLIFHQCNTGSTLLLTILILVMIWMTVTIMIITMGHWSY